VGHDLSRGIANYIRPERPRQDVAGDPAAGGPVGGGPIDEDAIERFGRELDEALPGAEFADHALAPDDAAAPF
jgi:hypothetical protein